MGIKVEGVELKYVLLLTDLKRMKGKEAEVDKKRAVIIKAEEEIVFTKKYG